MSGDFWVTAFAGVVILLSCGLAVVAFMGPDE